MFYGLLIILFWIVAPVITLISSKPWTWIWGAAVILIPFGYFEMWVHQAGPGWGRNGNAMTMALLLAVSSLINSLALIANEIASRWGAPSLSAGNAHPE